MKLSSGPLSKGKNITRDKFWLIVYAGTLLTIALLGCKRRPEPSDSKPRNLHEAAKTGDKAAAEEFLAKGMQVNDGDRFGWTPLHLAAWHGKTDIVELLLQNGAQVDARDKYQMTPLHWAAAYGQKDVAQLLVAKGANVNAKNEHGGTPLSATTMGRNECRAVAELLIASGVDVNVRHIDGSTVLHKAVINGQPEMLKLLLSKGANANAKDDDGKSPLDRAIILSETKFRRGSAFAKRKKAFEECVQILRDYEVK